MFKQRATRWFAKWTLRLLVTHTFVVIVTSLYLLVLLDSPINVLWDEISAVTSTRFDIEQKIAELHSQASWLWFVTAAVSFVATMLTPRTRLTRVPAAIGLAIVSAAIAAIVVTTQIEWDIVRSQTFGSPGYWPALFVDDVTIALANGVDVSLSQQRWLFATYIALSTISAVAVLALPRLLHRFPARHY